MMMVKWAEVTSRDSSSPVDVLSAVWRVGKGYSSGVIHRWAALTVGPVWKCHGLMGTGRLRQGQRALNPLWTGGLSEDSMTCFWFNLFYLIVLWMSASIFLILVAQPFIMFPSIRITYIKLFEMKLPHLLQLLVNDTCKRPDLGLSWFEKFSGCLIFPTLDVCQHWNQLFVSTGIHYFWAWPQLLPSWKNVFWVTVMVVLKIYLGWMMERGLLGEWPGEVTLYLLHECNVLFGNLLSFNLQRGDVRNNSATEAETTPALNGRHFCFSK